MTIAMVDTKKHIATCVWHDDAGAPQSYTYQLFCLQEATPPKRAKVGGMATDTD